MPNTLQSTINWAQSFIQYSPLTAGTGSEPAVSVASIIKNSILSAPLCWSFNRFEDSRLQTQVGVQDYTVALTNFGFLEKASLTGPDGKTEEIKDILNTNALSKSVVQQRPSAVSVISYIPGVSVRLRFLGVPEKIYTVNLTYQGLAAQFGPFVVNSAANAVGGNTTYTGIFSPLSFPIGSPATIAGFSSTNVSSTVSSVSTAVSGNTTYTGVFNILSFPIGDSATIVGFTNPSNNGVFVVVSVTGTTLVLANAFGLAETASATASGVIVSMNNGTFLVVSVTATTLVLANAYGILEIPPPFAGTAINTSWFPIPDQYSDVYNNLFLSEAYQAVGEDADATRYRQRGVAALLSKAEGLTETQKNAWREQWLARDSEANSIMLRVQQGAQARAI